MAILSWKYITTFYVFTTEGMIPQLFKHFLATVKTSCADPALLDPPPPGTRRSSCKPPNPVSLSEDAKATDEQIWSSKSSRFPSPSRQNPIASAAGIQFDNFRAPCSVRIWIVRWSLDSPLCSVAGVSGCPAPVDGEFERGIEEKEPLKWITMPGLIQRGAQFGHAPATACSALSGPAGSLHVSSAIWSRQQDDVSFDQLKKFWGEMQVDARRQLLRVDKQTVLEQARRNLYCSRCHGLLLQCYSQVVTYGKSLQQELYSGHISPKATAMVLTDDECDYLQDPSMHPWGGLATTKDGTLTLLDCFICTSSLDVLHKVFDSAQHREHDRELLYPDACGDGGRSWISQGLTNYGRGHGTREACALHTSSLSCDTLVDFWCALGDETRSSLFQMKEDDFIERLMYRFDSKRFCRDCRRNVLREFKELKELKRLKKELHCTRWFCISDTSIQYELSNESVQADWQHSFTDTHKYHHFEWAIGTAEGKTDILEFENVGLNEKVQANGLNLRHLSACFITVRAWKLDGRCIEICVKAHALKGQACVHRRLIVGDGFVSITKGDSIRSFFEHAEEIEEEEDDDYVDKDGNELDGDGSRPQKHAKSPELAREFLLDTATVIFKEQVEKAFREGTTRQNAHILFVSLAIKLLEEQLHVACKEIISIQKQIKLLEEEENEKREEDERRERRRNKEREKKLRRKERLKEREKLRETKPIQSAQLDSSESVSASSPTNTNDEIPTCAHYIRDSISDKKDISSVLVPVLVEINSTTSANEYDKPVNLCSDSKPSIEKMAYARVTQVVQSHMRHDTNLPVTSREMNIWHDCGLKNSSMSLTRGTKTNRERVVRQSDKSFIDVRFIKKSHSSHGKSHDVHVSQPHRTNQNGDYKVKDQHYSPTDKVSREVKIASTLSSRGDWTRRPPNYKHHYRCYTAFGRDSLQTRQIWEPMDATRKKYVKSNLDIDVTLSNAAMIQCSEEIRLGRDHESSTQDCISEHSTNAGKVVSSSLCQISALSSNDSHESDCGIPTQNGHQLLCCLKDMPVEIDNKSSRNNLHPIMVSSSDNCSSCTSEVDSSSSSSISSNMETLSTSDSENASQHSDGRDSATSNGSSFPGNQNISPSHQLGTVEAALTHKPFTSSYTEASLQKEDPKKGSINSFGAGFKYEIAPPQLQIPEMNNQLPLSRLPSEVLDYHNQNPVSWSGSPNISSCLPFSQRDLCLFPSPIGYGLHRFPEYGMQFSTLQSPATTAPFHLKQHQVHHGTSGVYDANTKTQLKGANGWTQKLANEAAELTDWSSENKESASELTSSIKLASNSNIMADESSKPFSLFHFGGPLFDSAACVVNRESGDTITFSKEETKMEEYSLFAAGSSSRFLFSSFTL